MIAVDKIEVAKNERCPQGSIRLHWHGDIGWGQYDLVIKSDDYNLKVIGYSECLDGGGNKDFLKKLLMSLAEQVEVVE